jgi:hypothetical protein
VAMTPITTMRSRGRDISPHLSLGKLGDVPEAGIPYTIY